MKIFENKQTSIVMDAASGDTRNYLHLLEDSINYIPKGIQLNEMRIRLSISDKIKDKKHDDVEFTDEEMTMLKALVAQTEWGMFHMDLVGFLEYVKGL
jgi:hypothetical protein